MLYPTILQGGGEGRWGRQWGGAGGGGRRGGTEKAKNGGGSRAGTNKKKRRGGGGRTRTTPHNYQSAPPTFQPPTTSGRFKRTPQTSTITPTSLLSKSTKIGHQHRSRIRPCILSRIDCAPESRTTFSHTLYGINLNKTTLSKAWSTLAKSEKNGLGWFGKRASAISIEGLGICSYEMRKDLRINFDSRHILLNPRWKQA